jgi:NTE family protein
MIARSHERWLFTRGPRSVRLVREPLPHGRSRLLVMVQEAEPKSDWGRHGLRINDIIDNQVRSLRKHQLIGSFESKIRSGTYCGVRSRIGDYYLPDSLPCPPDQTEILANTKTRLTRMEALLQERLINWGYAICDTAMRKWVDPTLAKPIGFPYQTAGVG